MKLILPAMHSAIFWVVLVNMCVSGGAGAGYIVVFDSKTDCCVNTEQIISYMRACVRYYMEQ